MIVDIDIWRAATLLLKQHGEDASIVAAKRADQCRASGDVDGLWMWEQIAEAILELLRDEPGEGEHFN
jgi:hypothetical protein